MIIKTDREVIQSYLIDASNYKSQNCDAVYFPQSSEEIVEILKQCNSKKTPVTISGAGTGLVGGRVPEEGIVISTEKLNRIINISSNEKSCKVESGVYLSELQTELQNHKLFYPPDPTEKNCFIGGTIATNASGARTFKYGPTRNWINQLKIILADGEILKLRRGKNFAKKFKLLLITESGKELHVNLPKIKIPNVKNAAGYFIKENMDAIDLFIGSEGTLGVIAEAELMLLNIPNDLISCVVFFESFTDAVNFVNELKTSVLDTSNQKAPLHEIRAIEFLDNKALNFLKPYYPKAPPNKFAIWFEQEIISENKDANIEQWIDLIQNHNASPDETWFALNEKESAEIREFRHSAPTRVNEYIAQNNFIKVGTDVAVADGKFQKLYKFCITKCKDENIDYVSYGHIGNNHLHLNMLPRDENELIISRNLYKEFCQKALELGGTISAEHGIGKLKREYFKLMYSNVEIKQMFEIKRALDPNLILGRGNIFDDELYR